MTDLKRSIRYLNQIQSCSIALLLTVALFSSWSRLGNQQPESVASGNEFSSNIRANMSTEPRQNITIKGDIIVENGTHLIENVNLNLTGKIVASNDATVIIRNATLFVKTPGYNFRDGILLADRSRLTVENATVFLESANAIEESYITVGDESIANITHSELHGIGLVMGRKNSRIYVNRSILKGPSGVDLLVCGVITLDNSTARIRNSELDLAQAGGNSSIYVSNSLIETRGVSAGGNGLIEIENSKVGTSQWLWDNSTIRVLNSTIESILFDGASLVVRDSVVSHWLRVVGNSTAWLTSVSASRATAMENATIWLINSYSRAIDTSDQGRVYVGWQLPLFGIVAVPYTWLPILQGIAILAALVLIIALLVFLDRRWKKWKLQKLEQQSQTQPQSSH